MKMTFKNRREQVAYLILSAFPLSIVLIMLLIISKASLSNWRICVDFNHYGEAWLEVAIILIATFYMFLVTLKIGGEKK